MVPLRPTAAAAAPRRRQPAAATATVHDGLPGGDEFVGRAAPAGHEGQPAALPPGDARHRHGRLFLPRVARDVARRARARLPGAARLAREAVLRRERRGGDARGAPRQPPEGAAEGRAPRGRRARGPDAREQRAPGGLPLVGPAPAGRRPRRQRALRLLGGPRRALVLAEQVDRAPAAGGASVAVRLFRGWLKGTSIVLDELLVWDDGVFFGRITYPADGIW